MTELSGYRPDQTPQGVSPNRLVFVDPADRHGREFEVFAAQGTAAVRGADSPEVNEMLEDAYRAAETTRNEAAARTPENAAAQAELATGIGNNALTFALIRPMVEQFGFDFDGQVERQRNRTDF